MTKIEYLKLALQQRLYGKKEWLISSFAIVKTPPTVMEYLGQVFKQPWGYAAVVAIEGEDNFKLEPIADTKANEPLFTFKDRVTIDRSWIPNAPEEPVETTIGNILFNYICILSSFGPKYPFILGTVTVKKIENTVAPKLQDTPKEGVGRNQAVFYVDEYVKFVDSLQFISNLSQLLSISATPKALVAPTGIVEFKQQLLAKYEGKLHDPVELSKFEDELLAFDKEFLKDDPAYGTFLSGKILHTARKKMFLSIGADKGFSDSLDVIPVTNSLEEGWPADPVQFTALMNSTRSGSFSRGAETVKGGVSAKVLLRAANNYTIQDTDCGSKLGISRIFDETIINKLVGRYLVSKDTPLLIEKIDQANQYLNKKIIVRSPMYCRLEGPNICRVCAGEKLFKFPTGVTIPLTEISSIILATSLKAMHSNVLSTAKLEPEKHFT